MTVLLHYHIGRIVLGSMCVGVVSVLLALAIASNAETYLGFHAKCPMFPLDFNRIWIFLSDFHKNPQYGNPSSGTWAQICGRTHGHNEPKRRFSRLCKRANNNTPKVAINTKHKVWKGKCIYKINSMALMNRPQRPKREAEVQVVNATPRPL